MFTYKLVSFPTTYFFVILIALFGSRKKMIKRSLLKNFTRKKTRGRLAKVMSINKQEKTQWKVRRYCIGIELGSIL
jgi:uncharacterized membrane protein YbaN (DUF454 family)